MQELIILFGPCNAGKTTTSKRLALEYANKGLKVCICETDIYKKDEFKNETWDKNTHDITVVDLFAHKTDYKVALNPAILPHLQSKALPHMFRFRSPQRYHFRLCSHLQCD